MTRNLTQAASDQVEAEEIPFAILLELGFDSGDVNLWSGVGDLNWDSKTWTGTGAMGSLSGVTEATDLTDTVIKATLSHIDASIMPDLVDEVTQMDPVGRPFTIYMAFFNPNNTVKEVVLLSAGLIDAVNLNDGVGGAISLDLVSEAGQLARTHYFRMNDQHQEKLFPGDRGFEFVACLDESVAIGSAQVNRVGKISNTEVNVLLPVLK